MEISPSLLDADLKLVPDVEKLVNRVHIDILPRTKFKPKYIKKLNAIKDVHLMVKDIPKKIKQYKNADIINFHIEAGNVLKNIKLARKYAKVSLAINPETRVERLIPFLSEIDEVLVMSVHPGKGGQKYINVSKKVKKLRELNNGLVIKVDGGLNPKIARRLKPDIAVMGSFLFNKKNPIRYLKNLKWIANEMRKDVIKMLAEAGSGHPGGSLGMADIFSVLFFDKLRYKADKPEWKKRDYLVLSNGHIAPILYSSMARAGFFPRKDLMSLRKLGSSLQGHPHREALPGLETSSGPLGCGISQAAGMALMLKKEKRDNLVYCIVSDGEQDEGNTWEGVSFAAKHKLDNLICIMDRNKIQLSGDTKDIMPKINLKKKYKAFGWDVKVINGHSIKQIKRSLRKTRKPLMIIAKTTPGKGVSFMENKWEWHGKAPDKEQAKKALEELK